MTSTNTLDRAQAISEQIVAWRRAIHAHPELGFTEFETAKLVARELTALGIEFHAGVGKTGIVADIDSGKPGKRIAIRADMDALPIVETNVCDYRSQTPGIMHACGHDAHTAMLLGAATLFTQLPPEQGAIRFLFQPCEETCDSDGLSGAQRMAEQLAMDGVDSVIALHVSPLLPVGTIGYDSVMSASIDDFVLTLRGNGGHAAMPHKAVDTVMILGQVINALYGGLFRVLDPMQQAVLSIGSVHGGVANNVIPAEITLTGTLRARHEPARQSAINLCAQVVEMARAMGADAEWQWLKPAHPLALNDMQVMEQMVAASRGLLGESCVASDREMGLGGEDFAYFSKHAPGAMLYLGTHLEGHGPVHTPTFDIDETALPLGTAILVESARRLML